MIIFHQPLSHHSVTLFEGNWIHFKKKDYLLYTWTLFLAIGVHFHLPPGLVWVRCPCLPGMGFRWPWEGGRATGQVEPRLRSGNFHAADGWYEYPIPSTDSSGHVLKLLYYPNKTNNSNTTWVKRQIYSNLRGFFFFFSLWWFHVRASSVKSWFLTVFQNLTLCSHYLFGV